MCDPVSALVLSGSATALNVVGQYGQARAQQNALNYQSAVSAQQAQIFDRKAEDARKLGVYNAQNARTQGRLHQATQLNTLSFNGVSPDVGTSLRLLQESGELSQQEQDSLIYNAERSAEAQQFNAHGARTRGQLQANQASGINPLRTALGAGLEGGSRFASSYYKYYPSDGNSLLKTG